MASGPSRAWNHALHPTGRAIEAPQNNEMKLPSCDGNVCRTLQLISVLRRAGGQSRESSDRRRGAYAMGPVEAACALYAATIASLSVLAAPLPPSIGLKKSK
jgi:hypothetical protein